MVTESKSYFSAACSVVTHVGQGFQVAVLAGQAVLTSKGLWDLCHGGDAGTKFMREQETQKKIELTDET